ncbi:MAG: TatD family hydrolase [Gammaproteobacteria bacterium]|tara:strand:- start:21 stop:800 length:780 start_codon:yes stop_codon:yes gene_type:complete
MSGLVDSHCHIPLLSDEMEVDSILDEAKNNNIIHMLCVAVDLEGSPEIIALAKQYEMVSASVGVHPNTQHENGLVVDDITSLAGNDNVVAIGETGLDYFRSEGDLEWQRDQFRTHITAAKELKKPLIIHSREAKVDVIQILKEEKADKVGGVMHCFVDDLETAKAAIDLDFLISFSGIVTFKNAKPLQEVARQISLKNMLIETDSPYLAPTPLRGKVNQPAYVRYVAEFLAELKEETLENIALNTTKNYEEKFNKINNL